MSEEQELYAEAMLGKDAEQFIESELGAFMIGRAEQEAEEAIYQLKTVWPWRKRKIQELQNRIHRAESMKGWLAELVIRGKQALSQLDSAEE